MVKIIIYSGIEIDFDKLKTFEFRGLTITAYGKITNSMWFVYGDYNSLKTPKDKYFYVMETEKIV